MLKIGPVVINPPVVLAPMAGVTDMPFRLLCKRFGCGLVCSEMVSDKALLYGNDRTRGMLAIDPRERPISIQLFGAGPETMAEAARIVEGFRPDIIDINMGCPAPKVVKSGEGAALLRDLDLAGRIIEAVVRSVSIPVTVKMRSGWDSDHIVAPDLARRAEEAGAAAVTVHARTREQFYSGRADWALIARVCRAVSIPVIGNGDVTDPASAMAMFEQTGCRGVMIGQGALGNPWVFRRVERSLAGGEDPGSPSLAERLAVAREHLRAHVAECGEERGIKEMRKHLAWYLKGMPGAAAHRDALNRLNTLNEVEGFLDQYEAWLAGGASQGRVDQPGSH